MDMELIQKETENSNVWAALVSLAQTTNRTGLQMRVLSSQFAYYEHNAIKAEKDVSETGKKEPLVKSMLFYEHISHVYSHQHNAADVVVRFQIRKANQFKA